MTCKKSMLYAYCEECCYEFNEINVYPCDVCRTDYDDKLKLILDDKTILVPIKYKPKLSLL